MNFMILRVTWRKTLVSRTAAECQNFLILNFGSLFFSLVAEIPTTSPKTPLYTDVRSPLVEVCHRLRVNVHWVDRKEQTMSMAYPIIVSTLPFKDVSARALADLAPPSILWTRGLTVTTDDEHAIEDVRHDSELPSYCRLIPTSTPYVPSVSPFHSSPPPPAFNDINPPTAMPVTTPLPLPNSNPLEEGVTRALRSVRSIMTQEPQGAGVALAKMFP